MKAFTTLFLSLAVLMSVGANAATIAGSASTDSAPPAVNGTLTDTQADGQVAEPFAERYREGGGCFWSGRAPFCNGECPRGYYQDGARDGAGFGATCWWGWKLHCCPK
ncbi:hypothetical protein GY45DRAFT_854073 [Cubamyces sp. BRFM 1775]|nr:hypothetical protein GY45DRAFT_854073 [Cubamyces sp. BRFM 1775]